MFTHKTQPKGEHFLDEITHLSPVLASIHEAVIITDVSGTIRIANAAAELITGYMPDELVGSSVEEKIMFVGKNETSDFSWFWKETEQGDRSIRLPETTLLRQYHGGLVAVEATTTPLYMETGEYVGSVLVLRNMSNETKVRQRQYEFLSFVSHQLRQPFGTIRWGIELIQGEENKLSSEHREMLADLLKLCIRFANFVNGLIDVARFEEGKLRLKREPADLRKIATEAAYELRGLATSHNVNVALFPDTASDVSMNISGDNDRLHDVFQNVLVNAIRYNKPRGKVTVNALEITALDVRTLAKKSERSIGIDEYLYSRDEKGDGKKFLLLTVADTGLGIPKDQQAEIFSNFFRGRNVQEKGLEGTGLGLFIIKAIVEGTGGRIFFTSEENVGTTFYMVFPTSS